MKFYCEIVQDYDGTYYANLFVNGKLVEGLPEYVGYTILRAAIKHQTGIEILKRKDMIFTKIGRKRYAAIDATKPRNDCRVSRDELITNYWKLSPE